MKSFLFAMIACVLIHSVSFAGCPGGICPVPEAPLRSTLRSTVSAGQNTVKKVLPGRRPARTLFRSLFR